MPLNLPDYATDVAITHTRASTGYPLSTELPSSCSEQDESNAFSQVFQGWHQFPSDLPYFATAPTSPAVQCVPPSPPSLSSSIPAAPPTHADFLSSSPFFPHMSQEPIFTTTGYHTMMPLPYFPYTSLAPNPTQNTAAVNPFEVIPCKWGCQRRLSGDAMSRHQCECKMTDQATRLALDAEGLCPVPHCMRMYGQNAGLVDHSPQKHREVVVLNPPKLNRASVRNENPGP